MIGCPSGWRNILKKSLVVGRHRDARKPRPLDLDYDSWHKMIGCWATVNTLVNVQCNIFGRCSTGKPLVNVQCNIIGRCPTVNPLVNVQYNWLVIVQCNNLIGRSQRKFVGQTVLTIILLFTLDYVKINGIITRLHWKSMWIAIMCAICKFYFKDHQWWFYD